MKFVNLRISNKCQYGTLTKIGTNRSACGNCSGRSRNGPKIEKPKSVSPFKSPFRFVVIILQLEKDSKIKTDKAIFEIRSIFGKSREKNNLS